MARAPLRFTAPDDRPKGAVHCPACRKTGPVLYCDSHGCPMSPGRITGHAPAPRTPEDGQTLHTPETGRPVATRED